jgi:ribosomal protein S18 acetylase RimI-like enzyme
MILAIRNGVARIRGAVEKDLPELARLDSSIFTADRYPYFVLRQLFDVHGEHLLVLEYEADLCGYALVAATPGGVRSWILAFGIHERYRGLGLGRRLLAEVLRRSASWGTGDLWLSVEPSNSPAVRLYRSFGFTPTGHVDDYFGPGDDRLIMKLAVP